MQKQIDGEGSRDSDNGGKEEEKERGGEGRQEERRRKIGVERRGEKRIGRIDEEER